MTSTRYPRLLRPPERSFFLFGPRGTGKSTWLRDQFADAAYFDMLGSPLSLELQRDPGRLEALVGARRAGSWVVIDEVQKLPDLLDEVHRLIESRGWRFALCGSSARKLRRRGTNLLGGRAVTRNLEGLTSRELGSDFDPSYSIEWGNLPLVQTDRGSAADLLNAYVHTYLREEIREEGIVRSVPPFVRFLGIAGQLNGQVLNLQGIARDAAVPRSTVGVYFSVLEDTMLGHFLPAYRPNLKVRETAAPKFYWFDSGVARAAAGLLHDPADRTWKGAALETLMFQELRVYNHTAGRHRPVSYYRTASGVEIDFVIETARRSSSHPATVVCVEVKLAERWDRKWEAPIRSLASDGRIRVERMAGVYTGNRSYRFDDFEVHPVREFLVRLHNGEFF